MTAAFPDPESWPYPRHFIQLREGRLHYTRTGEGTPVLLVHGTPTWSYEWRWVLSSLAHRFEVTAVDHLGFGLSDRPEDVEYSPEAHADRFRRAVDSLYPEGKVALVVHDFGGPIALDWALDHPDRLHSIVIVNSWMWPFTGDRKVERQAALAGGSVARFLYRRANASLRMIMPAAYADRRRLTPAIHSQYLAPFPDPDSRERVLFALARSLTRSEPFFSSLWARRERLSEVPVALLWGKKDGALPLTFLERWKEAVPHAVSHLFEEAGHWPHEELPEEFSQALLDLLTRFDS